VTDQIVEDLRGQVLSGALPDGARLPSERELATRYDVSGPTIREAIRVLTAIGLLSTRNGSRTTVTARSDALLAMSIASVVQLEKMAAADVFGVLGALNAYAVEQAVERASAEANSRFKLALASRGGPMLP
jgi:GntR family transcriptional repressor for pyruvate dehydrogenase complex